MIKITQIFTEEISCKLLNLFKLSQILKNNTISLRGKIPIGSPPPPQKRQQQNQKTIFTPTQDACIFKEVDTCNF